MSTIEPETYKCCRCGESYDRYLVADMNPCGCHVCLYCLTEMDAARKQHRLRCHCKKIVAKHVIYRRKKLRTKRSVEGTSRSQFRITAKPVPRPQFGPSWADVVEKPLRQFYKDLYELRPAERKEEVGNGLLLTLQLKVTIPPSEKRALIKTTVLNFSSIDADGQRAPSAEASQQVIKAFQYFHSAILPVSTIKYLSVSNNGKYIPVNELGNCMHSDPRLLPKCIFALATGFANYLHFDYGVTMEMSTMLASYLASDLVLRALKPEQVGPVIKALSFMYTNASNSLMHKTLAKTRVTTTSQAGRLRKAKEAVEYMQKGYQLTPRSLNLTIADNLNGKVSHGPNAGTMYEMTLINQRIVDNEEELGYDQGFSRVPRYDYKKDLIKKKEPEEILNLIWRAREFDFKEETLLQAVHMTVACELYQSMLSLEEIERRVEVIDFTVPEGMRLARMERIFDPRDLNRLKPKTAAAVSGSDDDDDDDSSETEEGELKTLWKKNNIVAGIPHNLKFSETATIYGLLEGMNRSADNQVEAFDRDPNNAGKERPIAENFIGFGGDNDPVCQMWTAKDADEEGKYDRIVPIPEPFHSFMEILRKAIGLNEDFVTLIIRPFMGKNGLPATDKNMSFFLNFSDPTDPERQIGVMLHACWHVAMLGMKDAGNSRATTEQLNEYVLKCAENSPQDHALYIMMKCFQLAILVRKSERTNRIELYFSAMRLALPLLAAQHAIHYVRTFTDILKFWETCDDHSRYLIRKYGFTMETPGGFFVGLDWGQEKCVRLVRDEIGDVVKRGMLARAENAATTRMEKWSEGGVKEIKKAVSSVDTEYVYRSSVVRCDEKDLEVFVKTVHTLRKIGAFQLDKDKHVLEPNPDFLFSVNEDGTIIDQKLLGFYQHGEIGIGKYCMAFHILNQNVVHRPETEKKGGVPLDSIRASVESSASTAKNRITLATSVVAKELNIKALTKAMLVSEFNKLREHFRRAQLRNFPELSEEMTKKVIIKELICWRTKAYNRKPNLKEEQKKAAEATGNGTPTTTGSRRVQLSHRFFAGVRDILEFDDPDDELKICKINYEL